MSKHEQFFEIMKKMSAAYSDAGGKIQMPPPMIETIPTEYLDFDLGKTLSAKIYFDLKFTNPLFTFQGGFLAAAIDNILGPLTYMAAQKPVSTIEMSTSFLRPFVEQDEYIEIFGEVIIKTRNILVMKAEVKNKNGKLIATATQHALILDL